MGAVRTTRHMAGRTKAGQRYAAYKEILGYKIKQQLKEPLSKAIGVPLIIFKMPIPASKAGKVKPGDLHTVKPDIDNLIKGLFDAANGVAWIDDNRVAELGNVKKIYGNTPGIIFEVEEIGGLVYGQTEKPKQSEKAKQKAARKDTSRTRRAIQRGI